MTRKHFEAFAESFRQSRKAPEGGSWDKVSYAAGWYASVHAFCGTAQTINPRFDRERFLLACGATVSEIL